MYVLDTNTVIHYLKNKGHVAEKLLATPKSKIALPSIVVFELHYGTLRSASPQKRQKQLHALLNGIRILPLNELSAAKAARIRYDLEKQGQTIGPMDVLIAATALANNATLVTHNIKEFARVKRLMVEDWYD